MKDYKRKKYNFHPSSQPVMPLLRCGIPSPLSVCVAGPGLGTNTVSAKANWCLTRCLFMTPLLPIKANVMKWFQEGL